MYSQKPIDLQKQREIDEQKRRQADEKRQRAEQQRQKDEKPVQPSHRSQSQHHLDQQNSKPIVNKPTVPRTAYSEYVAQLRQEQNQSNPKPAGATPIYGPPNPTPQQRPEQTQSLQTQQNQPPINRTTPSHPVTQNQPSPKPTSAAPVYGPPKPATQQRSQPPRSASPQSTPQSLENNTAPHSQIATTSAQQKSKPTSQQTSAPSYVGSANAAEYRQQRSRERNEPVIPRPEDQKLLRVQQAQQQAQSIWNGQPLDQIDATVSLDDKGPLGRPMLIAQWLDAGKKILGKGDVYGLENYFLNTNGNTLETLESIVESSKNPDSYEAQYYKNYLAPTGNPKDKVELIALKQNSLKELVNPDTLEGKRVATGGNDPQIVRAVTRMDAQGQPVTEYFVEAQDDNNNHQWVKIPPPSADQKIVTVDATEMTQGKQPKTIKSTVNISGGEQETKKRYNTINQNEQNYQAYINPTFTQYQQLRGNTPRELSGSNLRNEIGVAMNFTPNNAPMTEAEQKALKEGQWDLFSGDRLSPELAQSLTPAQQEKLKAQFKQQHETISKVEKTIREIGGDNAKVTTLPIMVDSPDISGVMQLPLFRVKGKDGKDHFVDGMDSDRVYDSFQDWKDNNKLPAGRVSYFADGQISSTPDGKPNIVTEKTHAVVDTPWEHVKQVGDWVATGVGIVVGAAAVGAMILGTGGLATPLVIAGGAAALWGAGRAGEELYDRGSHGESMSLADPEARSAWINLVANGVGFAAIGSSIRAGGAVAKVMGSADELGRVTASAEEVSQASNLVRTSRVLNAASTVTDGAALANTTYDVAKNWDKLTPEQRLFAIGQIGFWGGMMAHSTHEAMGNNFYASKDVERFMHSVGKNGLPETGTNSQQSKGPLHQKTGNLDTLYRDAGVAQEELSGATRLIAQKIGGEAQIPPGLKGRERTQEKIQSDYDGDASRITDLARSSIICENPQQVYQALGELESQFKTVRVKDRFENPVNGYRDMLVNLEMSNGHIVEVQLHLRSIMEVKNGAGHKLYEESRKIYAQAKIENRPLTPQEEAKVAQLERQQKLLYDQAYENALHPEKQAALTEQELGNNSKEKAAPNKANQPEKLSTGAETGQVPTPSAIREGSVRMEEHPQYHGSIKKVESAGFNIKPTKGSPHVVVREIVDANGNVIRVEKELYIQPGMRYLGIFH